MHTKTMEGLAGARTNMNMMNVPMKVYKEARRKGDLATMERAMGYVGDFAGKAWEYKEKADEGMKEDAAEAREKEKLQYEKAIARRKEERADLEEKAETDRKPQADIVEISEEGRALLEKGSADTGNAEMNAVFERG